jgi:hypothetical protein
MFKDFKSTDQIEPSPSPIVDVDSISHQRIVGNGIPIGWAQEIREKAVSSPVIEVPCSPGKIGKHGKQIRGIGAGPFLDVVRIHEDVFIIVDPGHKLVHRP